MTHSPLRLALAALFVALVASTAGRAQTSSPRTPSFVALADRFADAPVVAELTPVKVGRIAPDPAPGLRRYSIEANVTRLLRSGAPLPPRVRLLIDVARGSDGRWPKLKGQPLLVAARSLGGDRLQLLDRGAVLPAASTAADVARALALAAAEPGAAPRVTGVIRAFHVPGTIPGESETQVFLATSGGAPAVLTVVRRPGQATRWWPSFGEAVAVDGAPPARGTLAWYRLACGLPATLPETALEGADALRAAAVADYASVISALGACER